MMSDKKFKLGIISHPYIIYDKLLNNQIFEFLDKENIEYVTIENIEKKDLKKYEKDFDFKHFWNFGKELISVMDYYIENSEIDGILYITSFGCGFKIGDEWYGLNILWHKYKEMKEEAFNKIKNEINKLF